MIITIIICMRFIVTAEYYPVDHPLYTVNSIHKKDSAFNNDVKDNILVIETLAGKRILIENDQKDYSKKLKNIHNTEDEIEENKQVQVVGANSNDNTALLTLEHTENNLVDSTDCATEIQDIIIQEDTADLDEYLYMKVQGSEYYKSQYQNSCNLIYGNYIQQKTIQTILNLCKHLQEKEKMKNNTSTNVSFSYDSLISKYLYITFFQVYFNIQDNSRIYRLETVEHTIEKKIKDYIKNNVVMLLTIYDVKYLKVTTKKIYFLNMIFEKFKLKTEYKISSEILNKYGRRIQECIKVYKIGKQFFHYYVLTIIEKIKDKLDRLFIVSHLLYILNNDNGKDLTKLFNFIIYLKAYYENVTDDTNITNKRVLGLASLYKNDASFSSILANITGIDMKKEETHYTTKQKLIIYGYLTPYFLMDGIIYNLAISHITIDNTHLSIDIYKAVFEYSILLNYCVLQNIPALREGNENK